MLQTGRIEFTVLDFLILNLFWPRFVSDLDIRISDFDCAARFIAARYNRHRTSTDAIPLGRKAFPA
jgi:hypothetical protein